MAGDGRNNRMGVVNQSDKLKFVAYGKSYCYSLFKTRRYIPSMNEVFN